MDSAEGVGDQPTNLVAMRERVAKRTETLIETYKHLRVGQGTQNPANDERGGVKERKKGA